MCVVIIIDCVSQTCVQPIFIFFLQARIEKSAEQTPKI